MASGFGLNAKQVTRFASDLKTYGKRFGQINGMALNQTAFETRKQFVKNVEDKFTLRNKWTVKTIRFEKVRGFNPKTQFSVVGSTMDYMEDQEFGAVKKKSGKKGVAIPTTHASGESLGARPRSKRVQRPKQRAAIRLSRVRTKARSRGQKIFQTIRGVSERGSGKYAYLPFQRSPGIYRITGKKKRAKVRMVYDLSRRSVVIKKRPSLGPAVARITPRMPVFYKNAALKVANKTFRK